MACTNITNKSIALKYPGDGEVQDDDDARVVILLFMGSRFPFFAIIFFIPFGFIGFM